MSPGGNDQGMNIGVPLSLHDKIFQGGHKADSLFSYARIHRVPEDLRELKKSAYTPRLIAIGPLHREDPHLPKVMQQVKMHYANHLFIRVAPGTEDQGKRDMKMVLEECVEKMKQCVDSAKKYYAEEVKVKDDDDADQKTKVKDDDKIAEMMVIDGCFILELLYLDKKTKEAGKSSTKGGDTDNSKVSSSSVPQPINQRKADPIFDSILTAEIVKHDLLLLENQIPFFVLEELFNLTVDTIPGEKKLSLKDYVVSYFRDIMSPEGESSRSETKTGCCNSPSGCGLWVRSGTTKENEHEKEVSGKASETKTGCCNSPSDCVLWVRCGTTKENEQEKKVSGKANEEKPPYHILHLLHQHYLPEKNKERSGEKTTLEVRASDLDNAGVKFVPVKDTNLFAVNFKEPEFVSWWFNSATFEIPTLPIHDPTEPFLRNLIALEQCCPEVSLHFTSYAKLMDMLINSKDDVQVLQKAKVINNYLGSEDDVTELFNKLCNEVVLGQFYFNDECVKAFKYSQRRWPQFRAIVIRTCFASPWTCLGFFLAFITFGIQIASLGLSFK